jgi:hypothetical protein
MIIEAQRNGSYDASPNGLCRSLRKRTETDSAMTKKTVPPTAEGTAQPVRDRGYGAAYTEMMKANYRRWAATGDPMYIEIVKTIDDHRLGAQDATSGPSKSIGDDVAAAEPS